MRDIMIDIETLGTQPGSVIVSVGAVAFDAETGEIGSKFYQRIRAESAQAAGLKIDASTVAWWMQQSDEARSSTFDPEDAWSLYNTLNEFKFFIINEDASRVWGNGPSFDLIQLEAAYRAIGEDAPWSFRTHRDLRTLRDVTGVTIPEVGTAHNALDDAIAQTHAVIAAYKVLGLSKEQPLSA